MARIWTPNNPALRSNGRTPRQARTISPKGLSREERAAGRELEIADVLPRTRGECLEGDNSERPCPFVSCKYHLFLDANPSGSLKLNFPRLGPDELEESCALDVADHGGATLEQVGLITGLTRERVRQIEVHALLKLRRHAEQHGLEVHNDGDDK